MKFAYDRTPKAAEDGTSTSDEPTTTAAIALTEP